MSTRGILGFVIDGQVKATYNHSDSYPDYLGRKVLAFGASLAVRLPRMMERASALRLVTDDDAIEQPVMWRLEGLGLINTSVGQDPRNPDQKLTWYQALRGAQGNLETYLEVGYMEDGVAFANESLFCEWGYLVNFDDLTLEVYIGFQDQPHSEGRFAIDSKPADWAPSYATERFYYPIRLLATFDLRHLPREGQFLETVERMERALRPDEEVTA